MARYTRSLDVQVQGVTLLAHLSSQDIVKASALGACEAVVQALREHGGEGIMQREGCRALVALSGHGPNKAALAKCQGVAVLMDVLDKCDASTTSARTDARKLLRDLSEDDEARAHSSELRLVKLLS